MDWHARVRQELSNVTGDPRRDREIQEELADHLAEHERELREGGLSADDAERAVGVELMQAATRRRRRRSPLPLIRDTVVDLRYALRLLRRAPGFTAAALVTLALAIGATTALFTVVRGVLLRPLPFEDPQQLALVWEVSPQGDARNSVASANFLDWQRRSTSFVAMGARTGVTDRALTGSGEPQKIESVAVTPSVMDVLRARPIHGRGFTALDGVAGAAPVALLSHRFWASRFGARPGIVGQLIHLDDRAFTVIGVLPPGFDFPSPEVDLLTNLWFSADQQVERRSHNYAVIARLKPGTSLEAADAEMDAITAALAKEHPQYLTGWSTNVAGLRDDAVRDVKPLLWLLQAVAAAVLLIGCANLANLQLARAGRRASEMALRAAIGAGRGRVFRQMLTESLLLAGLGGGTGVLLAMLLLPVMIAAAPADIPYLERVEIDRVVLGVAALVTLVSAVAIGLVPALRVARIDLRGLLLGERVLGGGGAQRFRDALVVLQVAVTLVLAVSAGLLVRSFVRVGSVSPGYDPDGVLTVSVDLPRARYGDMEAQRRFYDGLFARLQALPSVAGAAGTTAVPGEGASMTFSFAIEGRPSANATGRENPVPLQGVTPDYFDVMRIPLLAGRPFAATDRRDAPPVVIVNQALARRHWPDGRAVGSRINFRPGQMPWAEVVGVVGDTRDEGLAAEAQATVYVPFAQRAPNWSWMSWQTLIVRARTADATSLVPDVRAALWALDPNLPLLDAATIEQRFAEREARRTLAMQLLVGFGLLALLLSAIGVYAVMAYSVLEQRRQIGIRLALGAFPRRIVARLVWRGVALALTGLAIGLGVGLVVTRSLASLLFEVSATDPLAFGTTALLLVAVTALAAWVPARRALRVDPLSVLRDA